MEQSPSPKVNNSWANQKFPHISWKPKVRLIEFMPASYTSRSTATVTSHLHLGLPSCFHGIRFPSQNLYELVLSPYVTHPGHLILLDLITWTEFVEEIRS